MAAAIVAGVTASARGANDVAGEVVVFNDNAGWSWFEDERAIVDTANGQILVSSVANAAGTDGPARNGDVDVAALDIESGDVTRFVLRAGLQADDHNSAALWQRTDGRYVAMYGTHLGDNLSRWRVSDAAGSISAWSAEQSLNNNAAMTYSNLHYLPNDNGGTGRLYNFVRSIGFDPNILVSNDQGITWSYGGRLLAEGGNSDRPYLRYFSDGNRIHFITTQRHPRDFDNSVFHGYIQDGQLFNSSGAVIDSNLFNASAVAPSALTTVFATGTIVAGAEMRRAWTVDMAIDAGGNPIAVFQARAGGSDTDHRFFYGRWNGSQWQVNQMAYAGSYLYAAENDYTGLVSIDPNDVSTVYLSSEVHPATKAQLIGADGLRHYELFKGTTEDGGETWNWSPVTFNSTAHNVRPLVPKWDAQHTALVWMRGSYTSYTNYDMDAVGLVDPEIPDPTLALAVDFGATGQLVQAGFEAFTRSADPPGNEQTEHYDSDFGSGGGQIELTIGGGNVQFVDRGNDVESPIGDVADDFAMVNSDMTLSLGNLAEGTYQLVLYSHDRDVNQLTADIELNGVPIGVLNPTTGADPTIGVSSSRVAFSHNGASSVEFTLDGSGGGGNVALNGFELYFVDDTPVPLVDLNSDGELDLVDLEMFKLGMHTDLDDLTTAEAYKRGDINGDFQNNYADFILFKQAYELWNGQGALAAALAAVPEPGTASLLLIGVVVGRLGRTGHMATSAHPMRAANGHHVVDGGDSTSTARAAVSDKANSTSKEGN
jgi:hypothetical protein